MVCLENAQVCLIVGTLIPNTSPVDLDVGFAVHWHSNTHMAVLAHRKSSLENQAPSPAQHAEGCFLFKYGDFSGIAYRP